MRTKKRKNKSAAILDWQAIWNELSNSGDRAAAIVGEAILDHSLSVLLSSYFVSNKQEANSLLDQPGPLSSLQAKSRLAYCLGLVTQGQLDDLKAINIIRNHFAHRLHGASFRDSSAQKVVRQLERYKTFLSSGNINLPRKQFDAAISMLAYSLSAESARVEHRQEMKAKSVSEILKELDTFESNGWPSS